MSQAPPRQAPLAVVVPSQGKVSFNWASRLATLDLPNFVVMSRQTAAIDLARQQAVEEALESGVKWILMLDSDVIPPRDVFIKLKSHNLDVVSALYHAKKEGTHPAMWRLDESKELTPVEDYTDNSIIDVDGIGLGCTLVKRRVFETVEPPWFKWTQGYENHPWDHSGRDGPQGVGEDFYFCEKVKHSGFNIYVDTSMKCHHEAKGAVTEDGYISAKKMSKRVE